MRAKGKERGGREEERERETKREREREREKDQVMYIEHTKGSMQQPQ
jgi:hypothetical protein